VRGREGKRDGTGKEGREKGKWREGSVWAKCKV